MQRYLMGGIALLLGASCISFHAAANEESFDSWLANLRKEAISKGISEATLDAALTGIEPIPRVIELDRKQPEFTLTFAEYLNLVVPDSRKERARDRFRTHQDLLTKIGKKYGVQPRFIVALWGIETDFGRVMGSFKVIPALASLAYDGRRSEFFRKELFYALQVINEGHITADAMMGSWAGAMGQSQFMPSSFIRYAQDYDGDGRRDIWGTQGDVFASAANYLKQVGWRDDITWGREVRLPKSGAAAADNAMALHDAKTWKGLNDWAGLGVTRADGSALPERNIEARLVLPDGKDGRAYLVYRNFEAILKWNRSNYFAIAVGTLSDAMR
ncbi:lytic transglycosylase domain-containing protein [Alphaproteobacteria bacterium LSUCC0684]